jgi:hypothetical protein
VEFIGKNAKCATGGKLDGALPIRWALKAVSAQWYAGGND